MVSPLDMGINFGYGYQLWIWYQLDLSIANSVEHNAYTIDTSICFLTYLSFFIFYFLERAYNVLFWVLLLALMHILYLVIIRLDLTARLLE